MNTWKKHWKKIILLVIVLICGIQLFRYIFPSFETTPNALKIYEGKSVELDVKHFWGIYKYMVYGDPSGEEKYSLGKYEYTLHNNTADNWSFGNSFLLQVKRGSAWESVLQDNVWFTLEARTLPPNSSVSDDLNLDYIYGRLPVGKYRIVKKVGIGDGAEGGPEYNIAGEFRVWF